MVDCVLQELYGWAMEASILRYDEGEKGFVRYTIQVVWRDLHWVITRRFSDFTMLHAAVLINTPGFQGTLPPKRWFGRFNPDFLKERKAHLQRYLDAVLALPSALESREVRQFFEVDRHLSTDAGAGRGLGDGLLDMSRGAAEQARLGSILDDTTKAFISISLPLYQASIEQPDYSELSMQCQRILERAKGFREQAPALERVLGAGVVRPLVTVKGPEQVIDVLSQQAALLLTVQNQLVEKPGLTIADNLREASQIRTADDHDIIGHVKEERSSMSS